MNTLIPLNLYNPLFFHIMFFFMMVVFLQSTSVQIESSQNLTSKKSFGVVILLFVLLYMGLRPVSMVFGDMWIYFKEFKAFTFGKIPKYQEDIVFEFIMYQFSQYGTAGMFFFFCAFLYVVPLYYVSKSYFNDYAFYAFMMLVGSFSFWAFGVNGIRNGIATSLFLYAITRRNQVVMLLLFILAINIHSSTRAIILVYYLTYFVKNTKWYFAFWFAVIPMSLALGGFWENFFLNLGLGEQTKMEAYLGEFNQANEGVQLKVGFRWDFLIYSATGVFAAWYYIIKSKFVDVTYSRLVNMYLFLNGLWILVIRSSYSNRFAYLSWFMLGLIIIYPLLKSKFFNNQHFVVGSILIVYFIFTYLLNVFLV